MRFPMVAVEPTDKPKKSKKRLVVLVIIAAVAGGLGYAYQQGMLPV